MIDLALISSLPEVRSVVHGQLGGALLESIREPDAEGVAAVTGFLASALAEGGEQLGLGTLRRVSLAGERAATLLVVERDDVVSARIEPGHALSGVERVIDAASAEQG
jgi:predicted regulator of Ras-like GTPase activity (Roadblock/LC7/MglB family)